MSDFDQANLANWNDRAAIHATDTTGSYRIARVLEGGSSLHEIESREIGDIQGRDVVHLQCHIGLDTLSLKHLGARSVTGLDFSPVAIAAARRFAAECGTQARFVEASVYDGVAALGRSYDVVFSTWGAINWLPDIEAWADVVAALLAPGGRLYLLDAHPIVNQLVLQQDGRLAFIRDRQVPPERPLSFDNSRTYTGDTRPLTHRRSYEWIHPLSTVISAVLAAGMRLDFFREHEQIAWQPFAGMRETGVDLFELPSDTVRIPLSFSIGATKPQA